ncbi:MAG: hypothetical protein J4F36_13095 [Nitrosopumilaceae archaeon]|nr:hypothetical protein [Nitrosopumilaceae archaeon]
MSDKKKKKRFALRLTNDNLNTLQNKTNKTNTSINTLLNELVGRTTTLDGLRKKFVIVGFTDDIVKEAPPDLPKSKVEEIAKRHVKVVKKEFNLSEYEYNLENVVNNFFMILEQELSWFNFNYSSKNNRVKLIVETEFGQKWISFLTVYLKEFFLSLKVSVDSEEVVDGVIIFEVSNVQKM